MKKRIGLTGGTGFIGQYLIRDFGDDYDFVAITSRDEIDGLSPKAGYKKAPYDKDGFLRVFKGCDAVVHLGASIPNQVSAIGSMEEYETNILTSERLLKACGELGIKRIVNVSSVSVYNKKSRMPLNESMPSQPDNCYGLSKVTVELMAEMLAKSCGFSVITLRVSQVLGYMRGRNNGFFSMLLKNACEGKVITVYGQGVAARDYIYVKDVSRAIVSAIERSDCTGVFNIGSGCPTTNRELAEAYIAGTDSASNIAHKDVENEDTRFWYMDTTKAKQQLGFVPAYSPVDMARDMKREMELAER